jgi:hypothetical protein
MVLQVPGESRSFGQPRDAPSRSAGPSNDRKSLDGKGRYIYTLKTSRARIAQVRQQGTAVRVNSVLDALMLMFVGHYALSHSSMPR